jgi:hypothetical protein
MSKLKMTVVGLVVGAIGFGLPVKAQQVVLTQSGTMFQPVQPVSQPSNEILGQNLVSQTEPLAENGGILAPPKENGTPIGSVEPNYIENPTEAFRRILESGGYIIFDPLTGVTTSKPFTREEIDLRLRSSPGAPSPGSLSPQSNIVNTVPVVQDAGLISVEQPKVELSEVSSQLDAIPTSQQVSTPTNISAIATYSGKLDPVLDASQVNPKNQNLSSSPLAKSRVILFPAD